MAGEQASLSVKIMSDIDKGSLAKQLKVAKKQIEDALKSAGLDVNVKTEKGKGGGESGGLTGGLGKTLTAMLGKLTIVAAIIGGLFVVFKPVFKIIKIIGRLLAEFLRPISDVVTILLMPILMILKPLLKAFQTLMMPIKKVAMQAAAMGSKLIGQGIKASGQGGGETGAGLIAEGTKLIMESVLLMLVPVMEAAMVFVVKGIELTLQMVLSVLEGIVNSILELFRPLLEFFHINVDAAKEGVSAAFGWAKESLSEVASDAITLISGMFTLLKDTMTEHLQDGIDQAKILSTQAGEVIKAAEEAGIGVDDMMEEMGLSVDDLKIPIAGFVGKVDEARALIEKKGGDITTSFNSIMDGIQNRINQLTGPEKKERKNKFGSAMRDIGKEVGSLGKMTTKTFNPLEFALGEAASKAEAEHGGKAMSASSGDGGTTLIFNNAIIDSDQRMKEIGDKLERSRNDNLTGRIS